MQMQLQSTTVEYKWELIRSPKTFMGAVLAVTNSSRCLNVDQQEMGKVCQLINLGVRCLVY